MDLYKEMEYTHTVMALEDEPFGCLSSLWFMTLCRRYVLVFGVLWLWVLYISLLYICSGSSDLNF